MMQRDFVTDHLAGYGVDLDDLRRIAEPLETDDLLLLTGSVVEGLANADSDVDLLLVGAHRTPEGGVTTTGTSCQVIGALGQPQGFDAQITIWTRQAVADFAGRFRAFADAWRGKLALQERGGDPRSTPWAFSWFSPIERLFLHRLRNGIPLHNQTGITALRSRMALNYLPLQSFVTAVHACYGFVEDSIAQAEQPNGDPDTALAMLHLAAEALAEALLAAEGETHPYPKWRAKLLKRHTAEIGQGVVDQVLAAYLPSRGSDPIHAARGLYALMDQLIPPAAARVEGLGPLAQIYVEQLRLRTHA